MLCYSITYMQRKSRYILSQSFSNDTPTSFHAAWAKLKYIVKNVMQHSVLSPKFLFENFYT